MISSAGDRVCIIIPTFNQEKWIGRAVESAISQDYPNKLILVIDDGSLDRTSDVVEKYLTQPFVRYVKNQTNIGRVANYRRGLDLADGAKWVINLDGDDYFTNPRFISFAIEQLGRYDHAIFFQGVSITKYEDSELVPFPKIQHHLETLTGETYFRFFFRRNSFSHLATVYHRQSALSVPFYSRNCTSSDIHSILKMCLLNKTSTVVISKEISGVWFQHEGNTTSKLKLRDHFDNLLATIDLFRISSKSISHWIGVRWFLTALMYHFRQVMSRLLR